MEKRKVLAVSVGVLAGCFILQSSAFADEGKTTVKVVQFKTELSEQMNDMAEAYMEEHPDVDLQIESIISEDYISKDMDFCIIKIILNRQELRKFRQL